MQKPIETNDAGPGPGPQLAVYRGRRPNRWWQVVTAAALAVALGSLGVALWSFERVPAAGPAGARGPAGLQGAAGQQGTPGAQGVIGPQGPSGTVKAAEVVPSAPMVSAPNPPVGTVLVATSTCPAGTVLLSGGARVFAPGAADRHVELRSSFPFNTRSWQTVGMVTGPLGTGEMMTVQAYVLCGTS